MKWVKLYLSMMLFEEEESMTVAELMDAIVHGEPVRAYLNSSRWLTDRDIKHQEEIDNDRKFNVTIISITASKGKRLGVWIEFKTQGILPPGVKHGIYKIFMEDDGVSCSRLPKEMFQDGDVPEDLIPPSRRRK